MVRYLCKEMVKEIYMTRVQEIRDKIRSFNNVRLTIGYSSSFVSTFSVLGTDYTLEGVARYLFRQSGVYFKKNNCNGQSYITVEVRTGK